jgi:hypothetical protein
MPKSISTNTIKYTNSARSEEDRQYFRRRTRRPKAHPALAGRQHQLQAFCSFPELSEPGRKRFRSCWSFFHELGSTSFVAKSFTGPNAAQSLCYLQIKVKISRRSRYYLGMT